MVTFILSAILIVLAALAMLIWPLLFTRNTISYDRHAQNIHYAKERLAELEEQLKNASISATDYEALKLEIETTLAQDIDLMQAEQVKATTLAKRPNKASIAALCVFLPLGSAAIYTYVGTPEALNRPQQSATSDQKSAAEVMQMLADLEQRLQDRPEDLEGWALLSRTYLDLGQFEKAKQGYLKVIALGGASADSYATLADASALSANGDMSGEPTEYVNKALALNPNNRQALWLGGLAAAQQGNQNLAKTHWKKLLTILADQPEQQAELKAIMAEALGKSVIASSPESDATKNAPQIETENKIKSETQTEIQAEAGISVNVAIDPTMMEEIAPNDVVFIFAKAVNGPPAPLAVKRILAKELPLTINLSDQDAMMPQLTISSFPEITISARVSKSGSPTVKSGDIESASIKVANSHQELVTLSLSTKMK